MYLRKLKSSIFYYTRVQPIDFLDHLQSMCGGLHAIEILAPQGEMQNAHKECDSIPEYINYKV